MALPLSTALCHNPVMYSKTKHMELDIFFLRENVHNKSLVLAYDPAQKKNADILNKPLLKTSFYLFFFDKWLLSTS